MRQACNPGQQAPRHSKAKAGGKELAQGAKDGTPDLKRLYTPDKVLASGGIWVINTRPLLQDFCQDLGAQ